MSRLIVSQGRTPATHPGTTEMKRVTMTDINAYLDGALDDRERAEFESVVESDPDAKALLAQHRQHVEELHRLYDPVLSEEVPSRMLELLRSGTADGPPARPALFSLRPAAHCAIACGRPIFGGGAGSDG